MVNHFSNNNLLTSKVGLCQSLKNLTWWTNDTMDNFFPKCFSLSKLQGNQICMLQNDIDEFDEDYRFIYSTSILKKYVRNGKQEFSTYQHKISSILVALNICEKRLLTIDE